MAWYDYALNPSLALGSDTLGAIGIGGGAPQNEHRANSGSLGLQHGQQIYDQAQQGYDRSGDRNAPTAQSAQINTAQQAQFRGQQLDLSQALRDRAMGYGGPSAAEMQLRQATDRNIRSQAGAAASGRGGQSALSQYNLANLGAQTQQDANAQAATLRANEQIAAQQSLGALLAQGREADIGLATSQAGFNQQTNLANQNAALQQTGLNDANRQAYLNAMLGVDRANQQGAISAEEINAGIAGNNAAAQAAYQGGLLSTAGGLIGMGLMASDERLKRDVRLSPEVVDAFLDSLDPYTFSYKDPFDGVGERMGVMAQDADDSRLGEMLVSRRPDGMRGLDRDKSLGAVLASVGRLNERLSKVEGKGKRK